MSVAFRPARADELQLTQELVVRSINDLTERHGFGPMATLRPPDFQLFSLKDDPDGLWVAESDEEIIGFALSWVCDDLWFLAELFVAPGHQGGGVGNELLARTLEHAKKAGATNKSLITFTFNVASQGLYIRHGLFPRLPIYLFGIARDALMPRLQGDKLRYTPIEPTASHLETLAQLDVATIGISRRKHHRYLLDDRMMKGVLLYDRGGLHRLCLRFRDRSRGPLGGRSSALDRRRVEDSARPGSNERSRASFGIPSRCERSRRHRCRAWHADYISNGAGVDA